MSVEAPNHPPTPETEKKFNPYQEYPGKPVSLGEVGRAIEEGIVEFSGDGKAMIYLSENEKVEVPTENQFSIISHTVDGLMEDLAPGSKLADRFTEEILPAYYEALENNPEKPQFGNIFYYPLHKSLVIYAPAEWHKIALVARNSNLIRNLNQSIGWEEMRSIFEKVTVGDAGASVGKNIFLRNIDTLRPDKAKIADPRNYKPTNINRTHIGFRDIGVNKAVVAARQVHEADPYISISVYSEGLHAGNLDDFLNGNKQINEFPVDFVIEETDDPDVKISLRQQAKISGKPVIMISDIGVGYQIDFRDFKKYPDMSMAYGISDEELLDSQAKWHEDKANRAIFFKFAFSLIGEEWRRGRSNINIPEFEDLIDKTLPSQFAGGIPQLGLAAHAGAGHVALMIAMRSLGYKLPERILVDPRSGKMETFGEYI
jgi:hypothetical protein